jgi:transposase|tara:strand:- start:463 stop:687 length:225 start_codon:yes stop_codon:yes gene_type:complete
VTDKKKLEEERKEIIKKLLKIQKEFMELERKKGVTEKDIHHNPTGIIKEYVEEHEKLANRLVDIAHKLKGSIRT